MSSEMPAPTTSAAQNLAESLPQPLMRGVQQLVEEVVAWVGPNPRLGESERETSGFAGLLLLN